VYIVRNIAKQLLLKMATQLSSPKPKRGVGKQELEEDYHRNS